jgi:Uma2 family endonuclease
MSPHVGKRSKLRRSSVESGIRLIVPPNVRLRISDKGFWRLCQENPDLRLERTEKGVVEIMPPTSGGTGARNAKLTAQVVLWAATNSTGTAFDSSAGFRLPNGATRSPDTSWIPNQRWNALTTAEQDEKFSPICPDFVIELRSRSDRSKKKLQDKMHEYLAQGAHLGWLIDPRKGTVEIYRGGRPMETLVRPATLSGEDVLPGFVLDLKGILFD